MSARANNLLLSTLLFALTLSSEHATAEIRGHKNLSFLPSSAQPSVPEDLVHFLDSDYQDDRGQYDLLLRRDVAIGDPFVVDTTTAIWRYQTQEEINSDGNTRIYVNSAAAELKIEIAIVVQPDGEVVAVDPDTIQVVDDQRDRIFSDDKVVVILWPALEPGATVILQRTRKTDTRLLPVPWSSAYYPRSSDYLENFQLTATWSADAIAPGWSSADPAFNCRQTGKRGLKCAAEKLEPIPLDDTVNYFDEIPHIAIGQKIEWSDLNQLVRQYVNDAMTSSEKIVAKANQLTAGLVTESEKLEAIHNFVARDVRYVGLEDGRYTHVPKDSDLTLQRRYGDCKGKTVLLLDLLRAAGIGASPVLVATRRNDPAVLRLPAAGYFNHMIACGELASGTEFCIDPTDEYSPVQYLSGSTQGAVSLNLDKDSQPGTLPADKYRWTMTESLEMRVLADGTLDETLSIDYQGPYGAWLRSRLTGMTDAELSEWAVEDYHSVISKLVTPEFTFDGVDELTDRLNVSSRSVYATLLAADEDIEYEENAGWLDQLLGFFDAQNDHYDYRFPGLRYEGTVAVRVDDRWKLDRPGADLDFKSEFGSLHRRHRIDKQTLYIETVVELSRGVMTVEQQKAFNRFVETLKEQNSFRWYGVLASEKPPTLFEAAKEVLGIY